jgi:hypothetical protein
LLYQNETAVLARKRSIDAGDAARYAKMIYRSGFAWALLAEAILP